MYLQILTPAQRDAYVAAAVAVLRADGQLHASEQALLDMITAEAGAGAVPEAVDLDATLERLPDLFADPTHRCAFLLELAGVTVIDGEAHPAEVALFHRFAERLELSGRASAFLDFAIEARALAERGRELIADTEGA
jgi:uncharacterized tellurite resistance protein B-like protein